MNPQEEKWLELAIALHLLTPQEAKNLQQLKIQQQKTLPEILSNHLNWDQWVNLVTLLQDYLTTNSPPTYFFEKCQDLLFAQILLLLGIPTSQIFQGLCQIASAEQQGQFNSLSHSLNLKPFEEKLGFPVADIPKKRILPCPSCGSKYNVSKFTSGSKVKCKKCAFVLLIPREIKGIKLSPKQDSIELMPNFNHLPLQNSNIGPYLFSDEFSDKYQLKINGKSYLLSILHPTYNHLLPPSLSPFQTKENQHLLPIESIGKINQFTYYLRPFQNLIPLAQYIRQTPPNSPNHVLTIIQQISLALQQSLQAGFSPGYFSPYQLYLDNPNSPTIFLDGAGILPRNLSSPLPFPYRLTTSLPYLPPETLSGTNPNEKSYTFSLGILLTQMLCQKHPFSPSTPFHYLYQLQTATSPPPIPKQVPPSLQPLLQQMLSTNPQQRPSLNELQNQIQNILQTPSTSSPKPSTHETSSRWEEQTSEFNPPPSTPSLDDLPEELRPTPVNKKDLGATAGLTMMVGTLAQEYKEEEKPKSNWEEVGGSSSNLPALDFDPAATSTEPSPPPQNASPSSSEDNLPSAKKLAGFESEDILPPPTTPQKQLDQADSTSKFQGISPPPSSLPVPQNKETFQMIKILLTAGISMTLLLLAITLVAIVKNKNYFAKAKSAFKQGKYLEAHKFIFLTGDFMINRKEKEKLLLAIEQKLKSTQIPSTTPEQNLEQKKLNQLWELLQNYSTRPEKFEEAVFVYKTLLELEKNNPEKTLQIQNKMEKIKQQQIQYLQTYLQNNNLLLAQQTIHKLILCFPSDTELLKMKKEIETKILNEKIQAAIQPIKNKLNNEIQSLKNSLLQAKNRILELENQQNLSQNLQQLQRFFQREDREKTFQQLAHNVFQHYAERYIQKANRYFTIAKEKQSIPDYDAALKLYKKAASFQPSQKLLDKINMIQRLKAAALAKKVQSIWQPHNNTAILPYLKEIIQLHPNPQELFDNPQILKQLQQLLPSKKTQSPSTPSPISTSTKTTSTSAKITSANSQTTTSVKNTSANSQTTKHQTTASSSSTSSTYLKNILQLAQQYYLQKEWNIARYYIKKALKFTPFHKRNKINNQLAQLNSTEKAYTQYQKLYQQFLNQIQISNVISIDQIRQDIYNLPPQFQAQAFLELSETLLYHHFLKESKEIFQKLETLPLTPTEQIQLNQLRKQIQEREELGSPSKYKTYFSQAEQYLRQNQFQKAIQTLQLCQQMWPSNLQLQALIQFAKILSKNPNLVYVSDWLFLSQNEVTNQEYAQFLEQNPQHPHPPNWLNRQTPPLSKEQHPVTFVNYFDALKYAKWKQLEIPTISEWEKAAKQNEAFDSDYANTLDKDIRETKEVGTSSRQAEKIHDLMGNVWEWVRYDPQKIPYPTSLYLLYARPVKGGSFADYRRDLARGKTIYSSPYIKLRDRGFRCSLNFQSFYQKYKRKILSLKTLSTELYSDPPHKNFVFIPSGPIPKYGGERTARLEKPFFISRYEVTNQEYAQFLQTLPPDLRKQHLPSTWKNGKLPPGLEKHPVVGIRLKSAQAYAAWKKMRLPTPKEWEAAYRGVRMGRTYPYGMNFEPNLCNVKESAQSSTLPVDSFIEGQSLHGCFNIMGNAAEWVWDPIRKQASYRGGSFRQRNVESTGWAKTVVENENFQTNYIGFRLAFDP